MIATEYRAGLTPLDLDGHLVALVEAQRRCEWLLCRYLADMADDHGYRRVGWYSDVFHYAKLRLSMSAKVTRERVRIGRALRELPAIEEAFVSGRLGYSRVRELTRVATRDDEQQWLTLGLRLGVRELERQVAIGLGVEEPKQDPADVRWRSPQSVELRMQLPASTWALLSRAMEATQATTYRSAHSVASAALRCSSATPMPHVGHGPTALEQSHDHRWPVRSVGADLLAWRLRRRHSLTAPASPLRSSLGRSGDPLADHRPAGAPGSKSPDR